MSARDLNRVTSRRRFVQAMVLASGATLLAACGQGAPATQAPSAPAAGSQQPTQPPAKSEAKPAQPTPAPQQPAAESKPTAAPAGQPAEVPRNRTLILMWSGREGKYIDHELWNPFVASANHQNGPGLFYEPLAYYSAFADEEILWLAESYEYSPDFKTLTIKTRSGINWSDGKPFSADDVAFTFESLRKQGAKVKWGTDVQQYVQEARATDANTVVVDFKVPAPRFFAFVTYKFDIGVYIVPKHIFESVEDWSTFNHFDLSKDWPVTTGPWKLVFSSPDQKIIDRRDSWWAVDAGLVDRLPQVERIVYLPFAGETQVAQAFITNQIDCSLDLRPRTIATVLQQNPNITTHVGNKPPYGYVDWWPTSLYVNCEKYPFDDPEIRWAISYFIDRQQVIDVGYGGAGSTWPLPLPSYPPLRPYVDEVKGLLETYDTLKFDPQAGADILTRKGWTKDGSGIWTDPSGQKLTLEIGGFNIFADIGPVIAEQLKRQGIDATYIMPPDMGDRFQQGNFTGMLYGHGGSVRDPYETLRLYQSTSEAIPGGHQVNFSRWKNEAYDKIVDEVYQTPMEDRTKLASLFRQAMEIWLPELPDIQIGEWYHRIPMNQTYWKGWPTEQDPYVNGAFWHLTFQLILNRLEPAQ